MKRRRLIIIALLVLAGLLLSGALLVPRAVRRIFYPLAPPMPPIVSKSTAQILSELEANIKAKAPQVLEQMKPGLSDEEIIRLEGQAGIRLPDEIRTLYRWRDGCRSKDPLTAGPIPGYRFVPLSEALGLQMVLSNQVSQATAAQRAAFGLFAGHRRSWISLFDDGSGDGYFFDPKRQPQEGAVFYSFAEDGSYVFFPSLGNLLAGAVKCYDVGAFWWTNSPAGSHLEEDFNQSRRIWDEFGSSNIR
jgi:cell wall assembly regulator SMI1